MSNNDYQMRGLPCRDATGIEMPWSVCGNYTERFPDGTVVSGGGVLEWCWDRDDAVDRMLLMQQDARFSRLSVRPVETFPET